MFNLRCPYCGQQDEVELVINTKYTNENHICSKCNKTYQQGIFVNINSKGFPDELLNTIPEDTIQLVKKVCNKYINKEVIRELGKMKVSDSIKVKLYDNCLEISLSAKRTYYDDSYRTVTFSIDVNGNVSPNVISDSGFKYIEKRHFKGDTLEEKISNYISALLLDWHII